MIEALGRIAPEQQDVGRRTGLQPAAGAWRRELPDLFEADTGASEQRHFLLQALAGDQEWLGDVGAEIEFCSGVEQFPGQALLLFDGGSDLPLEIVTREPVIEPAA